MDSEERRRQREEWRRQMHDNSGGRIWAGVLLLTIGGLLLARQAGADIPGWVFDWPLLLIAIGLLISFKSRFRNAGGCVMMIVGGAFLVNEIIPNMHIDKFLWPGIFILIGIVFIIKPHSHHKRYYRKWERFEEKWNRRHSAFGATDIKAEPAAFGAAEAEPVNINEKDAADAEFVEINAVFGSVNKLILSKNFKGGEVNAFMGGAEINLVQADIKQTVELEINAVFGGAKLILPGHWNVKNRMTAVFGGVEDKRQASISSPDANKTIILKGACVFGGIEIRNY
ncbi:LiaF transmembrane domain-containing protein [Parafilimonas sp.]|uniref:LiaF transmembrane domain-containing protein n=1 Tax=Parafilimonas sp. TaxID=1969739 RepID=UPI0039E4BF2E